MHKKPVHIHEPAIRQTFLNRSYSTKGWQLLTNARIMVKMLNIRIKYQPNLQYADYAVNAVYLGGTPWESVSFYWLIKRKRI